MKHIIEETIHYLNYVTQSDFHSDFQPTVHELQNLIDLGYTLDDFKKVIDKKWADWKGTDFQNYMRPSTLFGKKFENYLHESPRIAKSGLYKLASATQKAKQSDWKLDSK
jgi:uncharacterized phage protein (TIGR02220 family)